MENGRIILAASTGGHLAQLHKLRHRLDRTLENPLWITFDHPQSRSLLAGEDVLFVPYIESRGVISTLKCVPILWSRLRKEKFSTVYSTGAALSVPVFIISAILGIQRHYIESVSRFDGPSLSGRMVSKIPRTLLFTQHESWSSKKWKIGPSVLDDYTAGHTPVSGPERLKILVTLGTIRPYSFDRMIDEVLRKFGRNHDYVWQLGSTEYEGLPGEVFDVISSARLDHEISSSDLVITHAGVGSALKILSLGKLPILASRLREHAEHVDDHQLQITRELTNRGLALDLMNDATSNDLRDRCLGTKITASSVYSSIL